MAYPEEQVSVAELSVVEPLSGTSSGDKWLAGAVVGHMVLATGLERCSDGAVLADSGCGWGTEGGVMPYRFDVAIFQKRQHAEREFRLVGELTACGDQLAAQGTV